MQHQMMNRFKSNLLLADKIKKALQEQDFKVMAIRHRTDGCRASSTGWIDVVSLRRTGGLLPKANRQYFRLA